MDHSLPWRRGGRDFDLETRSGEILGLAGRFDLLRIGATFTVYRRDLHQETARNAVALDDVAYGSDAGPPPGLRLEVVEGSVCPGEAALGYRGAVPGALHALLYADYGGSEVLPPGYPVCPGTALGLADRRLHSVQKLAANAEGEGRIEGLVIAHACGRYLQLLDLDNCATSNVVQLP